MGARETSPPTPGSGRNVLVVSTVENIGSSLHAQLHESDVIKVVVPVVGQGVLDWLANDERAFSHSVKVADRLADQLPGETIDAGAGESDVALAIRDALTTFPADEIVVAVSRDDVELEDVISIASDSDSAAGARRIAGIPVRFVVVVDP